MTSTLFLLLSLFKYGSCNIEHDNEFAAIRKKPTFVDKTPLIYELLQHKYLFITAPSKFGKSTNLDMISLFLSNHRAKHTIENVFMWTRIWENQEFVKNNLGQHPVIQFNLKIRGYSTAYDHIMDVFKISLYNAFIDHMYLLDSKKISNESLSHLEVFTDLTNTKLMDIDTVAKALSFLAEALYQHHGKRVILLADEFGRGITERILQNHADLSSVIQLYSSVLNSTFCSENLISHALFSGENWLYGLKGPAVEMLEHVSFMQKVEFSRFYGFTYDEIDQLMVKFNISSEKKSDILDWYGGYSTSDGLFKVCNPFSILQYLSTKVKDMEVYWTGSALAPDLIQRMVEVDSLKKLIIDLAFRKSVDMSLENFENVQFLQQKVEELPQHCENFFLRILFETGYLTFDEQQGQQSKIPLKIPNEEVKSAIVRYTV